MAKNELLPFADGEDANVLPTNQWEALTDILENGFQSGIARSEQVNRVLAQGAVASYVLGQLIVDQLNKDATLDKDTLYQNIVKALQENAKDACLPLSGGTMTGAIRFDDGNAIYQTKDSDGINIYGGSDTLKGAGLQLFGMSSNGNEGCFQIYSNNGSISSLLRCTPTGSLTFNNKQIERVNSSGADYIRYESGLQICWGGFRASTTARNVTFPVAFASAPRVVASMAGYSISPGVPDVYETYMKVQSSNANGGNGSYIAIGKWK